MNKKKLKEKLCFALDFSTRLEAEKFIYLLSDHVGWFKVGLELFISCGPDIIRFIKNHGNKVVLDLKMVDIPTTIFRATMVAIAKHKVDAITFHSSGSTQVFDRLSRIKAEYSTKNIDNCPRFLIVTVLTNLNRFYLASVGYSNIPKSTTINRIAKTAIQYGINGFVASPDDCCKLKQEFGNNIFIMTPGIRLDLDQNKNDHQKIVTPAEALENKSDLLVVGRPIRDAKDPVQTVKRVLKDMSLVKK